MLEKAILERMIELMAVSDSQTPKKMLERSGVKFMFSGGRSGVYKNGMVQMDGSAGLVDFNVGDIQGFLMADVGMITEGMAVDQTSVIQDLQNQLAAAKVSRDEAVAGEVAAKDELATLIASMEDAVDKADDILETEGADEADSSEGVGSVANDPATGRPPE